MANIALLGLLIPDSKPVLRHLGTTGYETFVEITTLAKTFAA